NEQTIHRMKYGIFLLVLLFAVMDQSIMMILSSWIPLIANESSTAYSLSASFLYMGNLVFAIPLVKLSQNKGHRISLFASFGCSLVGMALLLFVSQLWVVYLARFLMGLNALLAVITHAIHTHFAEERVGSPLALYSAGYIAGNVIGSLVGNALYSNLGYYLAIAMLFIGYLGAYFSIWKFFPALSSQNSDGPTPEQQPKSSETTFFDLMEVFIDDPKLTFYMVAGLFNCFFLIGASSYAIYIIFTYYGVASSIGSLLFLIPLSVETATFLLMGKVQNWHQLHQRILPLLGIFCLFIIGIAFVDTLWMFLVVAVIFVILIAVFNQAYDTQFLQYIKTLEATDTDLTGIYRTVQTIGAILGPMVFGLLADHYWIFAPCILFLIVSSGIEFLYWVGLIPKEVDQWVALGDKYSKERKLFRAILCFRRVVVRSPTHSDTRKNLGLLYITKGWYTQAILTFHHQLVLHEVDYIARIHLGRAYYNRKNLDHAIRCFEAAVAINPAFAPGWHCLSKAYSDNHNVFESHWCLERAIELDPEIAHRVFPPGFRLKDLRKAI
ncbi:MAG: MFS transporter, partial [Promethearchaeota archaeon]